MLQLPNFFRYFFYPLWVSLALVACKKPEVAYYEVPREESVMAEAETSLPDNHPPLQSSGPVVSGPNSQAGMNVPPAPIADSGAQLSWEVPDHWTTGRNSSMRLGSYTVSDYPSLDVSITRFPGDVGGKLSNVNRWRGQIGLGPITADALSDDLATRTTDFGTFDLVSLHNPDSDQRMLVALFDFGGQTWFFKMTGPAVAVDRESEAFYQLVDSVAKDIL